MLTDWRVNVRVAIRAFENLPVPRRFVMTPFGEVAVFDSENSLPVLGPGIPRVQIHLERLHPVSSGVQQRQPGDADEPVRAWGDHCEPG